MKSTLSTVSFPQIFNTGFFLTLQCSKCDVDLGRDILFVFCKSFQWWIKYDVFV